MFCSFVVIVHWISNQPSCFCAEFIYICIYSWWVKYFSIHIRKKQLSANILVMTDLFSFFLCYTCFVNEKLYEVFYITLLYTIWNITSFSAGRPKTNYHSQIYSLIQITCSKIAQKKERGWIFLLGYFSLVLFLFHFLSHFCDCIVFSLSVFLPLLSPSIKLITQEIQRKTCEVGGNAECFH